MNTKIRENAIEEHGRDCDVCGETKDDIEIHHIDGDPTNNQLSNLAPVCNDCHNDIHSGELNEWAERILPRDERTRRVNYLMGPKTQKRLETIMWVNDFDTEKEAIIHAVAEYENIYSILEQYSTDLPSESVEQRRNGTFCVSESIEAILEQHIESTELIDEIREEMMQVVAERLFEKQIPVPEES